MGAHVHWRGMNRRRVHRRRVRRHDGSVEAVRRHGGCGEAGIGIGGHVHGRLLHNGALKRHRRRRIHDDDDPTAVCQATSAMLQLPFARPERVCRATGPYDTKKLG